MEATGVALGTVTLISTVLDIFRLVNSFRTYIESSAIVFRQLDLEREVLLHWATGVGLHLIDDAEQESRCIIPSELLPLVHRIVAIIGALLANATSLRGTKGISELTIQDLRPVLVALQDEIQMGQTQSRLSRSLKRLGWAIGEEERLKNLISAIHTYNVSLHNLIPKPLQIRLDGSLMQLLLAQKSQDELLELQQASFQWRKAVSVVAGVKALQQAQSANAPVPTNQLMLQRSKFKVIGSDLARYITTYETPDEKIHVLIEWRAYIISRNSEQKIRYLNTCLDLARLLHASQNHAGYRTMDCIGIIDDVEFPPHPRVGLVYRIPPIFSLHPLTNVGNNFIQIYTLYNFINSKQLPRPRLDQRFNLARSLATGLHRLFVSRWYHKNLNSKNILFLALEDLAANKNGLCEGDSQLLQPFLSGFDYARPDSPDEVTIKPETNEFSDRYRHPRCTHRDSRDTIRYSRQFDMYSLGVLLIELGRWETVDVIQKEYTSRTKKAQKASSVPPPPPSLQDFQRYLQTRCVDSLGFRMGKIYMEAVRFCLHGCVDNFENSTSSIVGEELLVDKFNKEVVAELAHCIA